MHPRPARSTLVAVFALAILGISVSGPLARLSASPPLAIAVWRLLLSMLIVAVPLVATGSWRELRALSGGDVAIALGAGAFLALHFWSWIASLGMTSVAASVLLVNLHPVVIVAGSALWLRERPTRTQLLGIAIALLGAAVVAFAGSPTHGSMRVAGSLTHGSVRVADSLTHGSVRVAERDHALRDLTSSRTVPSGAVALGSGAGLAAAAGAASEPVVPADRAARAEAVPAVPVARAAHAEAEPAVPAARAARAARAESELAPAAQAEAESAVAAPRGSRALLGNALALLGALTVGLYYLAGRRLRQRLSLWPYVALVYGACLLVLLALAAWQRTPLWPQPPRELGIFALIALGPMLAGHTGFNWALRYVPAVVVSTALLAEPVGAGLIAWALLGEAPGVSVALGGFVVLVGLGFALRADRGAEGPRSEEQG